MSITPAERERLANQWNFNWPVMDVLIAGKSSIDLPRLDFDSLDSAHAFLASYGYDVALPADRRHLHAIYLEAILFIERHLMPGEWSRGLRPPPEILDNPDPAQLLIYASAPAAQRSDRAKWACAILRVMHTIAHIEGFWRSVGIGTARESIRQRFMRHISADSQGRTLLGGGAAAIELAQIDWKDSKSRESIILKLLHKRGNVAETIYDLLGVRIVTKRLCDVMLAVKFLQDHHIVTFPNCNPARARNTLLDEERFKDGVVLANDLLTTGKITEVEFRHLLDRAATPAAAEKAKSAVTTAAAPSGSNPHTAQTYRSIQLTCRYLVHMRNPALSWLRKLQEADPQSWAGDHAAALQETTRWLLRWHTIAREQAIKVFVPFEIQIMDKQAFHDNKAGDAAHDRYKAAQIRTARRRVLAEIL